jgi:hypothetical protein
MICKFGHFLSQYHLWLTVGTHLIGDDFIANGGSLRSKGHIHEAHANGLFGPLLFTGKTFARSQSCEGFLSMAPE